MYPDKQHPIADEGNLPKPLLQVAHILAELQAQFIELGQVTQPIPLVALHD